MNGMTQFLPYLLIFAVFYFLIIMPQQKRAKKEKQFESELKIGDKIITKSGMHGKVAELNQDNIVIETMAGKLKLERSAISMELSLRLRK